MSYWSHIVAALAIAALAASVRGQDFNHEVMISTAHPDVSTIDIWASINDFGVCAFTGRDGASDGRAFVVPTPGNPCAVTFGGGGRLFRGVAINNAVDGVSNVHRPGVATRDRVGSYRAIRRWEWNAGCETNLSWSMIGNTSGDFDSAALHLDLNDGGVVAFSALTGGSSTAVLMAGSAQAPTPLAT